MKIEIPERIGRDAMKTRRDAKGDGIGVEIAAVIAVMIAIVSGGTGGTGVVAVARRIRTAMTGEIDGVEAGAGATRTGGSGEGRGIGHGRETGADGV